MSLAQSRLFSEVNEIKNNFLIGKLFLRKEGDSSVLYGESDVKYKNFQLVLNPYATYLMELILSGVNGESLFNLLIQSGLTREESISALSNIVSISRFDRTNTGAVKDDVVGFDVASPIIVTWDITNVCNLTCDHCFNSSGPMCDNSLSVDDCVRLVDEFVDIGIRSVWIGGGEPLMKKGIDTILHKMKNAGIRVILATNGVLLKSNKLLKLVGDTCSEVNISLDGHTSDLHSLLRGQSAKLEDSIYGIRRLKTEFGKNIYVTALTVVHKKNLNEISQIIDFAYDLECDKWTHDELYAQGRGGKYNNLILAHEEYDKLFDIVSAKAVEYSGKMHVEDYVRMHKKVQPGSVKSFYGCTAGNQEIAIQHDGSIYPCQKLQYTKYYCGNIKQVSLKDVWVNHPIMKWLRNRNIEDTECSGCGIFASGQCNGGCLAEKEIHFQRHDTRDPLCPENRGMYQSVLNGDAVYPYKNNPIREKITS